MEDITSTNLVENINNTNCKYDVFLSAFSDHNLRTFTTDHVCSYLEDAGLKVYRDDADERDRDSCQNNSGLSNESLPTQGHMKAIEESKICVIIFSVSYTKSLWCLRVLAKTMECMKTRGQVVIPVYNLSTSPSDVVKELDALVERYKSHSPDEIEVEKWQTAVAEVATLPKIAENSSRSDFIKQLIQMVVDEHVNLGGKVPLAVPQHNVELSSQMEHIGSLLNNGSNDVRIIGIFGRNGTGKTELAKAIFDQKHHEFIRFCFLQGDGHSSERIDNNLKDKLVSNLLARRDHFKSENLTKGKNETKVLIVVEDIDKVSQLERLEKIQHFIGSGSRIVATTNDRRFLDKLKVDEKYKIQINAEEYNFAQWKYDVFLSAPRMHRLQACFTDNICNGLQESGIRVFRDDAPMIDADYDEICARINGTAITSESLPTEMQLKAIEESRISIIIFLKCHAASRRCLMVSEKIIDCVKTRGQVVIPVFYNISRSDLTSEKGKLAKDIAKYYPNETEAHRWRAAVAESANLPGITRGECSYSSHTDLIKQLIQMVVDEHVNLGGKEHLTVHQHNVELSSQVEHVCSLLNRGSKDMRIIGILGRNGSGKTELAKAIFDRTHLEFENFCLFKGEGYLSPRADTNLRDKLVSNILARRDRIKSEIVGEGGDVSKTLIVVDDIDKASQLKRLERLRPYIGPGSRILVTTSDRHLLYKLKVDEIHKLKLNSEDYTSARWKYDVYVSAMSFYITKALCTDNLCNSLEESGIRVFRDDVPMLDADLPEFSDCTDGNDVTTQSLPSKMQMRAIEESRVSVIIFMASHAESRQCLMVITKIMECMKKRGQVVIPVFYTASRSYLSAENGKFAEHIARFHPKETEAHVWRAALAEAANLPGIEYEECSSHTDFMKKLIQMIVDEVVDLGCKVSLPVVQDNIKLISEVEDVGSLLNKGSKDVQVIGILGRRGSGKTILAKALFDRLSHEFDKYCFFKSGGHFPPEKDNNLRDKLVSKLQAQRDKYKSENATVGRYDYKMLIIIDDINMVSQLQRLENIRYYIGPGSRIILTTRDRRFLDKLKVDERYKIKWNVDESESLEWKYDVFLSAVRSHIIKDCITDHICNGLEEVGIRVFRDDIPFEESIPTEEHMKAIEESQISVILFPNRHSASRRWLMVSARIMKCMKTKRNVVIPAFCNTTLCDQFSKEQGKVIERFNLNEAEARLWHELIAEAAELPSLDYDDCSSLADFINQLVQLVLDEHVDSGGKKRLAVMQPHVGLDSHVQYLSSLLNKGSKDVRIIGILGVEGSGKTTLAKALFDHLFHEFELFCLLSGNELSSTEEDPNSQEILVLNLLSTMDQFKSKFATGESGKCDMLIVVDDIEKLSQLMALEKKMAFIGLGSRIIVTTKDEHFLDKLRVDEKYKMKLDVVESIELFNRHAFGNAEHSEGYDYLMYHLVRHANGHLPAIKGLSSYLSGRPIEEWKLALLKVGNIPEHQIQDKLSTFSLLDEDDTAPTKNKVLVESSIKKSLESKSGSCSHSFHNQSSAVSRVLAESLNGTSCKAAEDVEVFLMKAPSHDRAPVTSSRERRQHTRNVRTFECPICCKHFINVVSTACGHVACGSCLLKSIAENVYNFECKVCWEQFVESFDASLDPIFCESCVIKSTAGSMKCPICRTSIGVKGNKLDLIFTKAHGSQKLWLRH